MTKASVLDNIGRIRRLDKSGMLDILLDFPEQLRHALQITDSYGRLGLTKRYSNIVFTGMGGSGISGDIVRSCVSDEVGMPFLVNRDYALPKYVNSRTVVFVCSYSGNTEETISAYKDAKKKGADIVVITSGGALERMADKDGRPLIKIPGGMPPRCAIGYFLVPAIVLLSRLGLIKDKRSDIEEAVEQVTGLRDGSIGPGIVLKHNEAKRIASLLAGRFCAIYGSSKILNCAVERWRAQICENAKTLVTTHYLPEMAHNEIMGFRHPKWILKNTVVVFLGDKGDHIFVQKNIKVISSVIKNKVCGVLEVGSTGQKALARLCALVYMGDFVSFYLAVLNGEDPTPVKEIDYLKKQLHRMG